MSQDEIERSDRYMRHYLDAEAQGRDIAATWIGHPNTKAIIEHYRPYAQNLLDKPPLGRFTVGERAQGEITRFTYAALNCAPRNAGGVIGPSIFDPRYGWAMESFEERLKVRELANYWASLLVLVANALRNADVPIDTQYGATVGDRRYCGDLIALGELLALSAIDLDTDARVLVDEVINTAPPMHFGFHDHQPSFRHRRPDASDRTAIAIQRGLVEDATGETTFLERRTPRKRDPAAAADGSPTQLMQIRHRAILKVYHERGGQPSKDFTVYQLRHDWVRRDVKKTPAGRMIRLAMEEELNRGKPEGLPWKEAATPSARTLRRDLKALGIPALPDQTSRQ